MELEDVAGNESVTSAIDSAIHKTAALVVVLSDSYLSFMWCQKEIRAFVESAGAQGRLFVVHLADIALEKDLSQAKLFVQLLGSFGTRRTEDVPEGYEGLQLARARAAGIPATVSAIES